MLAIDIGRVRSRGSQLSYRMLDPHTAKVSRQPKSTSEWEQALALKDHARRQLQINI